MCALLLHYLPWCIHIKWPYTSVNMSSHRWWHPKSVTSTPFPHRGTPQHQWAALWVLWWLSIILDNVSQWQSRHRSKVIFTPTVGHVHVRGRAESSINHWMVASLSISLSFCFTSPVLKKKPGTLKVTAISAAFQDMWNYQDVPTPKSRIRSQKVTFTHSPPTHMCEHIDWLHRLSSHHQ